MSFTKEMFAGVCPDYDPQVECLISDGQWAHYKQIGIKTVRVEFMLRYAGGSVENLNFTRFDALVNRAKQEGIEVMMLVDYDSYKSTPQRLENGWADYSHRHEDGRADWMGLLDVMEAIGPHYAAMGVHSWEIWNEQNAGWHMLPEDYVALIAALYEKFHYTAKWDPDAKVCLGGLDAVVCDRPEDGVNAGTRDWFAGLYKTEAYAAFHAKYGRSPWDAVSFHNYGDIKLDKEGAITYDHVADCCYGFYKVMMDNGDAHLPIWITEVGDQNGVPEFNGKAARAFLEGFFSVPCVERVYYFKYRYNDPGSAGYYSMVDRLTFEAKPVIHQYEEFVRTHFGDRDR